VSPALSTPLGTWGWHGKVPLSAMPSIYWQALLALGSTRHGRVLGKVRAVCQSLYSRVLGFWAGCLAAASPQWHFEVNSVRSNRQTRFSNAAIGLEPPGLSWLHLTTARLPACFFLSSLSSVPLRARVSSIHPRSYARPVLFPSSSLLSVWPGRDMPCPALPCRYIAHHLASLSCPILSRPVLTLTGRTYLA